MFSTLAFYLLFSEEIKILPPDTYVRIIDTGEHRIINDGSTRILVE
jgi:hypothetical protein